MNADPNFGPKALGRLIVTGIVWSEWNWLKKIWKLLDMLPTLRCL